MQAERSYGKRHDRQVSPDLLIQQEKASSLRELKLRCQVYDTAKVVLEDMKTRPELLAQHYELYLLCVTTVAQQDHAVQHLVQQRQAMRDNLSRFGRWVTSLFGRKADAGRQILEDIRTLKEQQTPVVVNVHVGSTVPVTVEQEPEIPVSKVA